MAGPAAAVGLSDAGPGLPLTIEDATPVKRGALVIESALIYKRQSRHEELFSLQPRLKYGAAQNLELSLALPYSVGDGEEADSGALEAEAQYLFLQEAGALPAMAVGAQLGQGVGDAAGDTTGGLSVLASKQLGQSKRAPTLHLNLGWEHAFDSSPGERRNRRMAAIGVIKIVHPRWAVLADVAWEEQEQRGVEATLLEAGARYQLTGEAVISAGLGAGLESESPDLRLTLGWQQSF